MKKYLIIICSVLILLMGIFSVVTYNNNINLRHEYEIAVSNNKAYEAQLTQERQAFQFTVEQLRYINDSTVNELDSIRRELKIKDNRIKQMSKIREYVYITDSLIFHDTIFAEPEFVLDTALGDQWYTNNLHLEYPNKISSTIDINTDQSVFLHTVRETINPPKKTWLGRLFQRKHDVYNVTVVENNPYATVKENKFIIIK